MKSKKVLAVILALVATVTLSLTACNSNQPASSASSPSSSAPASNSPEAPAPSDTAAGTASLAQQIYQTSKDTIATLQSEIDPNAVSSRDTFTFGALVDPGKISLDNMLDLTTNPMVTSSLQYLLQWDPKVGTYVSDVCESYALDADQLGVTFHIKPGIMMNDGNTLGAQDIITSIEAFRAHNGLGWQLDFVDLDSSKIIDPLTLDLRFKEINGVWEVRFEMLTLISGKAYDAVGGDESFYQAPVGPQAYDVTEWVPGDHITFTRFDNFFLGKPLIKTMVCKIISDETAAFMALQNGDIDLLWNLNAEQVQSAYKSDSLNIFSTGTNYMIYMAMNCANKALSDFRVRQAIYMAINRQDIIDGAYDGLSTFAYSILTPETIGYNKDYETNSPFPPNDIDKAKQLMADAGYGDGLNLRILAQSTNDYQLMVEMLSAQLSQIGITLTPTLGDYATVSGIIFSGDTSGYDIFLQSVEVAGDGIGTIDNPMLFGASHPELSSDGSGDALNAIYRQIETTTDLAQRTQYYKDLQAFFFEKGLYWVPMSICQTYVGLTKDLTGLRPRSFQIYFNQAYFK